MYWDTLPPSTERECEVDRGQTDVRARALTPKSSTLPVTKIQSQLFVFSTAWDGVIGQGDAQKRSRRGT